MALTEKHRNAIYQYLAPEWGDDVTQAFLSQFPAREGEEPITRDFLRAEIAGLRGEMSQVGSRLAGLVIGTAGVVVTVIAIAATAIIALA